MGDGGGGPRDRAGGTVAGGGRRAETGRLGEAAAREYLEGLGCAVLDANWRCRAGELDLVVRDPDGVLRFVEVRSRSGRGFGTGAESVTADKCRRVRRLATHWLADRSDARWERVVFDVVSVDLSDPARPLIEHLPEAF